MTDTRAEDRRTPRETRTRHSTEPSMRRQDEPIKATPRNSGECMPGCRTSAGDEAYKKERRERRLNLQGIPDPSARECSCRGEIRGTSSQQEAPRVWEPRLPPRD
ncbi:hypothetical protein BDV93DRAFT_513643 [Ceratobasidium sp. AG-I]|nr:hypothetical protein BDV93DRAFT_513643 [Ceratobasidium sp. AG-I]